MTSMYGVMGSTLYEIFIELVGREEEKETCVWTSQVPSLRAPVPQFYQCSHKWGTLWGQMRPLMGLRLVAGCCE